MRLALYEPDIALNTGTMLRMAACLGIGVDVIEPCGFPWDEAQMRRSGMDYLSDVAVKRHMDWYDFKDHYTGAERFILLSTKASLPYVDFQFEAEDILIVGSESAGVPEALHESITRRVLIPMCSGMRSLNVAISAAMVLGEAFRQTGSFPIAGAHSMNMEKSV